MKLSPKQKIDLADKEIHAILVQMGTHKKALVQLKLDLRALNAKKVRAETLLRKGVT